MVGEEVPGGGLESQASFQREFSLAVRRHFDDLTRHGMDANEAAALALKIAAGVADAPISVAALHDSIDALQTARSTGSGSAAVQDVCSKTFKLFSSADALHAAFWAGGPRGSSSSLGAGAPEPAGSDASASAASATAPLPSASSVAVAPPPAAAVASDHQRLGVTDPTSAAPGPSSEAQSSWALGRPPSRAAALASATSMKQALHLDTKAVSSLYAKILGLKEPRVTSALGSATEKLIAFIARNSGPANPSLLRQLSILLLNPLLEDMEYHGLTCGLAAMLVGLPPEQGRRVVALMAGYDKQEMQRLVIVLQQYITLTLYQQQTITQGVEDATRALGLLHEAASLSSVVHYSEFYNDAVNNEDFNLKEDFRRWKSPYKSEFSFCTCPYVYDPASKARVLQMENQMAQYNELHTALFRGLFNSGNDADVCPFLVLKVRRGAHLIGDTLIQINRAKEQHALRKPLKVKFVGEEGVDEGGVQKEFFQLLVRELFNPDYGMFTYDEATRLHWFRPSHLDMDTEFELVGILIGLAIYNSHILEFQFPLVLYKKLMGARPGFDDLQELYPEVHSSLSKLMEYEGEVEPWGLVFQAEMEVGFGQIEAVDLVPNGGQMAVTTANRQQYVELYMRHLLESATERQFSQFRRGFLRLCNGTALSWFRPQELELLVCGGRHLDLEALKAHTLYDDGYTRDAQVVRWFWDVVHNDLDEAGKKRLLFFVTGSDRVPIKGLAHLNPPFVISRMGGESDRLPTAHTCFNHLLLPAYSSREALAQRLRMALDHAEGFGLM